MVDSLNKPGSVCVFASTMSAKSSFELRGVEIGVRTVGLKAGASPYSCKPLSRPIVGVKRSEDIAESESGSSEVQKGVGSASQGDPVSSLEQTVKKETTAWPRASLGLICAVYVFAYVYWPRSEAISDTERHFTKHTCRSIS